MQKVLPNNAVIIPDNARKVFAGNIFDVYQWPQLMFDGSTKTFEMLRRPDTVQIIAVDGSKILLVDDEQPGRAPRVHFPGGRVDDNDTSWLVAAQRELREETGIICSEWRLISVAQPIIKIEWFAPIFVATGITEQVAQELDTDGEKITCGWYEFDDVRSRVLEGGDQMMQYLVPFFSRVKSLDELLSLSEFVGVEVDR